MVRGYFAGIVGASFIRRDTDRMIVADNLKKRFGEQVAVDGLSLEIRAGETFGLLGPNGAGKTTTINMLVGLLQPDEGLVSIGLAGDTKGHPALPAVRRRMGISPQSLSLYEELTARENLSFFAGLYGLAGDELKNRCDWALDFSGLSGRQKDRVANFSGGMKRRLNIAVAMIHEPSILFLDEPTVGVDPQSRNHIFDSIQALSAAGLTIVYTTHYMEEAQRLCDRVAIVDHGKRLALDTVAGLIQQYGGDSVVTAEVKQHDGKALPGTLNGNQLRFETSRPLEEIASLSGKGVEFQSLNVAQPNLEGVFLSLTGRNLRD